MAKWYMVLQDGRYSELDGCAIVGAPSDIEPHQIPGYISEADGYYCFTSQPTEIEPNNGVTIEEIEGADLPY